MNATLRPITGHPATRLRTLMLLVAAMLLAPLGAPAQEGGHTPVAVLSGEPTDRTLTFTMAPGATVDNVTTFGLPEDEGQYPAWLTGFDPEDITMDETITKVVFAPSFAQARPSYVNGWFMTLSRLAAIEGLEYLDTSESTHMVATFFCCSSLTSVDLSHLSTARAEYMSGMFYGCSGLTSLDLSRFEIAPGARVDMLLAGCTGLTELNLGDNDLKALGDEAKELAFYGVGTADAPVRLTVGEGFDKAVLGEPDADGRYSWLGGTFRLGGASAIGGATATPPTDAPRYNLRGQRVGKDYRGVVIQHGKKHIANGK